MECHLTDDESVLACRWPLTKGDISFENDYQFQIAQILFNAEDVKGSEGSVLS